MLKVIEWLGGLAGELITLLPTFLECSAHESSHGNALPANDGKSAKQSVVGSNPTGGDGRNPVTARAFSGSIPAPPSP